MVSATAAGLAGMAWPAFAAIDPKLHATLDEIARAALRESPEGYSYLGLDSGENSWARARLRDRSLASRARVAT